MQEGDILKALQQAVTAAVAASTMPSLPVSYVGVKFTTPNEGGWLELVWLPNNVQGDLWGQDKHYRGILRMVLHWPNDGAGIYRPLTLIGSIVDQFTVGLLLSGVQIYGKDLTGVIFEGDETLLPVSLRYVSYREG